MSDITTEIKATEIKAEVQTEAVKSLHDKRLDLRLRLQLNRQLLENKLTDKEQNHFFPRSATMRFLSQQSTHQMIKKAANAALGLQTIKAVHYGYTLLKFFRKTFLPHKKATT